MDENNNTPAKIVNAFLTVPIVAWRLPWCAVAYAARMVFCFSVLMMHGPNLAGHAWRDTR